MELRSHKGLIAILLLSIFHLCQAQDSVTPSFNPEPAPPSLGDVIGAVRAAFEEAVKFQEDGAVREVFEQVVEELVPQVEMGEHSPVKAEEADDHLVAEHRAEEHTKTESKLELQPAEEEEGLVQEPVEKLVESVDHPNNAIEDLVKKIEEAIPKSTREEKQSLDDVITMPEGSIQKSVKTAESVQGPEELVVGSSEQNPEIDFQGEPEVKSPGDQRDVETVESPVQMEVHPELATVVDRKVEKGQEGGKQKEKTLGSEERVEETNGGNVEEGKLVDDTTVGVHKESALDLSETEQTAESQPGQELEFDRKDVATAGKRVENNEGKREREEVDTGLDAVEAEPENIEGAATPSKEESEGRRLGDTSDTEELLEEEEVLAVKVSKGQMTSHTPAEDRTGRIVDIKRQEGSHDPVLTEYNSTNEPNSPGQGAWKIGAIAAAFFLILQTVVTVVYIVKCKRKPKGVTSEKMCEEGSGGVKHDAENIDAIVPVEEQTCVDDFPEDSQIQQEAFAMTTIRTEPVTADPSSSRDPRPLPSLNH